MIPPLVGAVQMADSICAIAFDDLDVREMQENQVYSCGSIHPSTSLSTFIRAEVKLVDLVVFPSRYYLLVTNLQQAKSDHTRLEAYGIPYLQPIRLVA